jgi:spermidine/putrescine transport system permease protein
MIDRPRVLFGEHLTRSQELRRAAASGGPALAWLALFLLLPLLGIVALSFVHRGVYGQLEWSFTLANYKRFLGFGTSGFDPIYLMIVLRSLAMAAATTVCCALAAFPLAFFISGLPLKWRHAGLMLVVIPFWTNLLIRTYAWQLVLSSSGWLARAAASAGFIEPGQGLYPSTLAVFLGMTCDYLPFLVLPLYASVEKIDWTIAEAASDLGANRWRVFWHALLPQIRPGLLGGMILVFVPASGQFVVPDLLGGAKTVLIGNAVQQQFGQSRDWPFGSALACLAMVIVLLGLWLYVTTAERGGREEVPL